MIDLILDFYQSIGNDFSMCKMSLVTNLYQFLVTIIRLPECLVYQGDKQFRHSFTNSFKDIIKDHSRSFVIMSFINSSFFIVFSHYFSFLAEGKECNYGFDYIIADFPVKSSNKTYFSNRLLKFSGKDYYNSLFAQMCFLYESNVTSSKQTHST